MRLIRKGKNDEQIVTVVQTCIIGFVLAWLYSDMSKTFRGIQDEIGILFFVSELWERRASRQELA